MSHLNWRKDVLLGLALATLAGCGVVEEVQPEAQVEATALGLTTGTGLRAEYFNNADLTSPVLTRTDAQVNFDWRSKAPAAGIGADTFSVRWTGSVLPSQTDVYTLCTQSDEGVRLWLDGRLVIDNWSAHSLAENQFKASLTAGVAVNIRMEYFDGSGSATAKLLWSSTRTRKQAIPTARLYPFAVASGTAPVTTVDAGTAPVTTVDAGTAPVTTVDAGTAPVTTVDAGTAPVTSSPWLRTSGNRILTAAGSPFRGRGANLADTRGCGACAYQTASPTEVKRRVDELVNVWKANFIRLDLESYATAGGRMHWAGLLQDPAYLADIKDIVRHIGTKPGVYVMVSLWAEPTVTTQGWPSASTGEVWKLLARTFANDPHVIFGLVNEPEYNYDGLQNAAVWTAMNDTVALIRSVEDTGGTPRHLVSVQGTGGWARFLDYYTTHPITAGGGQNVAYEVHVYDPPANFADRFVNPAKTLPVIIGEFGPASGYMTLDDTQTLMAQAEVAGVPYLAWTFHGRCPPNLIEDLSGGGCGINMSLRPTAFGTVLKNRLAMPW